MRLIDADNLIKQIEGKYCRTCNNCNYTLCEQCDINNALRELEDAHIVDAIPVVRCKDCDEWYAANGAPDDGNSHFCMVLELWTKPDFYCAGGRV